MASQLQVEMESKLPVREWNRNTVADGKLFNMSAAGAFVARDDFLANHINDYYIELAEESAERISTDTKLNNKLAQETIDKNNNKLKLISDARAEIATRKATDAKIEQDLSEHASHLSKDDYDDGHIEYTDFQRFESVTNTVNDNKDNWDNISTIKVGQNSITASDVTLVGDKFIGVTVNDDSNIEFGFTNPTEESIGESKGVYLSNGEFKPCDYEFECQFGDSVITINDGESSYYTASAATYINQSETPILTYDTKIESTIFGRPYTSLVQQAVNDGANNITVRIDSATHTRFPENIVFYPKELDKYKMYTLNIVPVGLPTDKNFHPNINIVFSANKDDYINYSDATYASVTFGYLYNVPQFGTFKNDYEGCITMLDDDHDNDDIYVPVYKNRNVPNAINNEEKTLNNLRWQLFLNDNSESKCSMYTIQPHGMSSVLFRTPEVEEGKTRRTLTVYDHNLSTKTTTTMHGMAGFTSIKGKMASLYSTHDSCLVYRRQLSFMRGDDIDVDVAPNINDAVTIFDNKGGDGWKAGGSTISNAFNVWLTNNHIDISDLFSKEAGDPTDTTDKETICATFNQFLSSTTVSNDRQLFPYAAYAFSDKSKYLLERHIQSSSTDFSYVRVAFGKGGTGYTIYFFTEATY